MATLSISLPVQLSQKADAETKRQGFSTRSEFIRSLIRKYLHEELTLEPFVPVPLDQIRQEMTAAKKYNRKFIDSVIAGLSRSSFYADKTP